ncbi:zinc finger protein 679-like [Clinocottus analis]|uniref:zinc finger protein 679-like n=1 Tax=Clinocottus analis TaxID=304258 RepID=UPI0035C20AFE
MSLDPHLREFVHKRLTAAADEIFVVFQKAIVEYEEEIRRQRRLLDIVCKPDVKLHRIELPQQDICNGELLSGQQEQLRDPELRVRDTEDTEPPQIKAEQGEHCTSAFCQGEELLYDQQQQQQQLHIREPELCVWDPEPPQIKLEQGEHCTSKFCMGEELCYDQQQQQLRVRDPKLRVQDQELRVEDPDPLQIKAEQEELCTSEEGVLILKPETDAFMFPTHEERYHSEDQTLNSHNSHEAESQDLERSEHGDSGATGAEPKQHFRHHESQIDSYNVCYPSMSTIHCFTHTGKNVFKCDVCEKMFQRNSDLQRHRAIHSDEKPYSCEICGKKFRSSNHLTVHMRTHTDERPYLCMTCGKTFRAGSALNRHKVIHTGEKPYICIACGRAFRLGEHLRSHMRTHTDEKLYLCKTCGKRFKFLTSFKKHVRNHTSEELYLYQT